jgi:hypothetical protein
VAVVDHPALLADSGEARARGVQRVELSEHGILGLLVDDERLIAALARRARLDDALAARRVLDEDVTHSRDRPATGAEPVGLERMRGRRHRRHTRWVIRRSRAAVRTRFAAVRPI